MLILCPITGVVILIGCGSRRVLSNLQSMRSLRNAWQRSNRCDGTGTPSNHSWTFEFMFSTVHWKMHSGIGTEASGRLKSSSSPLPLLNHPTTLHALARQPQRDVGNTKSRN